MPKAMVLFQVRDIVIVGSDEFLEMEYERSNTFVCKS